VRKRKVDLIPAPGKYTQKLAWNECLFHFARHNTIDKWEVFNREFHLSRGQFYCNKSKLAKRWGWTRRTVIRFFARKQKAGEIIQERHPGVGTIISVVDLDKSIEDSFK